MIVLDDVDVTLHEGDCVEALRTMDAGSVDCVVTSPPYMDTRADVPAFTAWGPLFEELARVVKGGMLWNVGRVWRDGQEQLWWLEIILAARAHGWEHWDTVVWVKPNANPIHGRLLANSHEYVLAFGRAGVEFNEDAWRTEYSPETIARLGRRWGTGGVKGDRYPGEPKHRGVGINDLGARARSFRLNYIGVEKGNPHPTPMGTELAGDLVRFASWEGQTVLDPFHGSGTTSLAARAHGRRAVGIELNPDYNAIARDRLSQLSLLS